ncbi:MAG: IS91 family transposase [Immundisolibacteraceae bacterium]|nr:IS91 family transposase [Immundisolibacteraceae bacterium]
MDFQILAKSYKDTSLSDVLRAFSMDMSLTYPQQKVINNLINCKSSSLGSHSYYCHDCSYLHVSYNSCRDRHCNKCQALNQSRWIEKKMEDLLPVKYFHLVFTLPEELNPLILRNKGVLYNLLFKAVNETLSDATRSTKNLGADIGYIATLHTWGQMLNFHPHIHCIVPSGGLSLDGKSWIKGKDSFFLSVKVLKTLLKYKYLDYLKKYYKKQKISMEGIDGLQSDLDFERLINLLYSKSWHVYAKPTFKGPKQTIQYLGNYVQKVAISNSRILSIEKNKVSFKYFSYKKNKTKYTKMDGELFVKRFLMHILPKRFVKTRSYGYFANSNRQTKLKTVKKLLGVAEKKKEKLTLKEELLEFFNMDLSFCPKCKSRNYHLIQDVLERSPPFILNQAI